MEKLVLMEALAEVTGAMRAGVPILPAQKNGETVNVPFSHLNRMERVGLLNTKVDWLLYSQFGVKSEDAWRIVQNAADGKPQDRWLEPVRGEHDHSSRPSLGELLKQCGTQPRSLEAEHGFGHESLAGALHGTNGLRQDGKAEMQRANDGRSM